MPIEREFQRAVPHEFLSCFPHPLSIPTALKRNSVGMWCQPKTAGLIPSRSSTGLMWYRKATEREIGCFPLSLLSLYSLSLLSLSTLSLYSLSLLSLSTLSLYSLSLLSLYSLSLSLSTRSVATGGKDLIVRCLEDIASSWGEFGGTFFYARTDLADRSLQPVAAAREIDGIPNHDFLCLARHWICSAINQDRSIASFTSE